MADGPSYNERVFHRVRGEFMRELHAPWKILNQETIATTAEEEPVIPDPSLFAILNSQSGSKSPSWHPPSVAECAIHLEFLTVLHVLKGNVLASNEIDRRMGYASDTRPLQKTLEEWQARKWTKFVDFAVVRFLTWADFVNDQLSKEGKKGGDTVRASNILLAEAPLDVLMVWTALLLNPGVYWQEYRETPIYKLAFPWDTVHACIDNQKWVFETQSIGQTAMEQMNLPQDLFQQFKTWPFPAKQRIGHKYVGLKVFNFGERITSTLNGEHPKHDEAIKRYASLFANVNKSLAKHLRSSLKQQEIFADKMVGLMWIRSPAVEGTLWRATERYDNLMELVKHSKGKDKAEKLVPTEDIDLVWRTHLCAGERYSKDMDAHVERFVSHPDSLSLKDRDIWFSTTRKLYEERFNSEYKVCGCWDCELLVDEMEKVIDLDADEVKMKGIAERAERKLEFYRSVEIMRRFGERLPMY